MPVRTIAERRSGRGARARDIETSAPGFTLIELLVVIAIMAVVIGTIGACLAAGIRVWERARTFNTLERDASIGLALMEKDVRNMLPIYAIGFDGKRDAMRFPAVLHAEDRLQVGSIEYSFKDGKRALVRRELSAAGAAIRREVLMANVTDLTIDHLVLRRGQRQGQKPRWEPQKAPATNFPDRVDVALSLQAGEEDITLTRTILLPAR